MAGYTLPKGNNRSKQLGNVGRLSNLGGQAVSPMPVTASGNPIATEIRPTVQDHLIRESQIASSYPKYGDLKWNKERPDDFFMDVYRTITDENATLQSVAQKLPQLEDLYQMPMAALQKLNMGISRGMAVKYGMDNLAMHGETALGLGLYADAMTGTVRDIVGQRDPKVPLYGVSMNMENNSLVYEDAYSREDTKKTMQRGSVHSLDGLRYDGTESQQSDYDAEMSLR